MRNNRTTHWRLGVAAAVIALLSAPALAATAAPAEEPLDDATVCEALRGRFVKVVISDKPSMAGRQREVALFVLGEQDRLTLVGITEVRYVDRDRDRHPDPGEVRHAGFREPDAEAGGRRSLDGDDFLARAAHAARTAMDAGELIVDVDP